MTDARDTGAGDPRAKLDALLEQALDHAPSERERFLAALDRSEPRLAGELRELVALALGATDPLPAPDGGASRWRALFDQPPAPADHGDYLPGRVGVWQPKRVLGRGGMGAVYLVERDEGGFRQSGALKLLRPGVDSAEFLQRFAQERQILAGLNHPGIARLLDGGCDAEGRPYLVMEYVDGEAVDAHCDRLRLSIEHRLALFVQIAQAVAYAHRNLVAHRDLKPSNIMVTAAGEVKLLDFGIAKVLSDDAGGEQPMTRTAMRMFTPEYATPEQILGRPAAASADIYQLGLLLYELLTGQRAQQVRGYSQQALEEAVCRTPATRPSERIAGDASEIGMLRSTTAAALRRKLQGDLDNIVSMALRKEPERRYGAAEALIDDLQRWRQGHPVRARPESIGYIGRKFVRRHAWAVTTAAVMLAMIVGYAVTVTLQANAIAHERDRARAEAAKARQVQGLVLKLFEGADPEASGGTHLSARELLDQGWIEIEHELAGQPEVQVEVLGTVGEAYRRLGEYDRANAMLARELSLARATPAIPPEQLIHALQHNGRLRTDTGAYDDAGPLLREALDRSRALADGGRQEVADSLMALGLLLNQQGRYRDAETLYEESLAIRRTLYGPDHPQVAETLGELGAVKRLQGDYAGAAALFEQSLAMYRRRLRPTHPRLAQSLSNLAIARSDLGEYDAAIALYREALTRLRASLGEDHHHVAVVMNNLAKVLQTKRDFQGARALLEGALAIRTKRFGERHPMVALNLNDLGLLLAESGDPAAAEAYYRQALAAYAQDHPWRAATIFNYGRLLEDRGDYAGAERRYREALRLQTAQYGPEHDRVGADLNRLGIVLHRQGRLDEAESSMRQALVIYRKRLPPGHQRLAVVLAPLGELMADRGRIDEAGRLLEEAMQVRQAAFGSDDPRTRKIADSLARLRTGRR